MRRVAVMPLVMGLVATTVPAQELLPHMIKDDAIALPLAGKRGDAARGAGLVMNRQASLCLLCHQGPFPEPHAQGTLAPDLRGVGGRLSEGQIRLRVADMPRLNASTIMPSYYRINAHDRIAAAWRGKPVLEAQAIEDIVAFLVTLKD